MPKSSFLLFETSNACNDPFRLHFLGKKLFSAFLRKKNCVFVPFSEFIAKNCKPFGFYEDLWSTYTNTIAIIVGIIRPLIGRLTQFHFISKLKQHLTQISMSAEESEFRVEIIPAIILYLKGYVQRMFEKGNRKNCASPRRGQALKP